MECMPLTLLVVGRRQVYSAAALDRMGLTGLHRGQLVIEMMDKILVEGAVDCRMEARGVGIAMIAVGHSGHRKGGFWVAVEERGRLAETIPILACHTD